MFGECCTHHVTLRLKLCDWCETTCDKSVTSEVSVFACLTSEIDSSLQSFGANRWRYVFEAKFYDLRKFLENFMKFLWRITNVVKILLRKHIMQRCSLCRTQRLGCDSFHLSSLNISVPVLTVSWYGLCLLVKTQLWITAKLMFCVFSLCKLTPWMLHYSHYHGYMWI